ncbi:MAG: hypothetical protein V4736_13895 [Bdellovibrionota bacterium]
MSIDLKLESYLSSLDKALGGIPVSDRADIITEIKSHVLVAKERDPSQTITSILSSLGEPETVANRYLIERGLKPGKAPKRPIVKWLTIGFLGTLGILVTGVICMVWFFSPLISIDEKNDRVRILGGMIDINGSEGSIRIGDKHISAMDDGDEAGENDNGFNSDRVFQGSAPTTNKKLQRISVSFKNGKVELEPTAKSEFRWKCRYKGDEPPAALADTGVAMDLDLTETKGVSCKLEMPKNILAQLRGSNGKIIVSKPIGPVEIEMNNGKVGFESGAQAYKYDVRVNNGASDSFESSTEADAIAVKITLNNGKIEKID